MTLFRISRRKYASDLTGHGAEITGGRWNSRGIPAIYTSDSRALCALEVAVHLPLHLAPVDYCIISLSVPENLILTVNRNNLPDNWSRVPHSDVSQKFGDLMLLENRHLGFRLPSAIVPEEFNVILNPKHPTINEVQIVDISDFPFDERLFSMK